MKRPAPVPGVAADAARRRGVDLGGIAATVLLLWAQVVAIVAPGCLVRCTDDDGREAIELVGSECCRAAHVDDACARSDADVVRAPSDRCRDVPLRAEQVLASRTTIRSEPAVERIVLPAIAAALEAPRTVTASSAAAPSSTTAPDPVPRGRRAFVLRC